uniref:Hexosyltransferase n=1 Tax=Opuntia streptacantha TaxID=393608 RepID=A0A7C9DHM5_OPUST
MPCTRRYTSSGTPPSLETVIGAPEYRHANFSAYFKGGVRSGISSELSGVFSEQPRKPCYFNTGVMVMDLGKWRTQNYCKKKSKNGWKFRRKRGFMNWVHFNVEGK